MTLTALDMMKGWVEDLTVKNRALEEEIKTLKLTNVTLTQELEMERMSNGKTSVNVETQVDEVTRSPEHRRKVQSANGSDADMNSGQQIPRPTTSSTSTGSVSERGETSEKSRMSGSVLSMSSKGVNSSLNEIPVKEEHYVDEFTQYIQTESSSMDEDMEIDIKEEDVGYGQSKQDCDNSIHDPSPLGDFRTEVETDCEPNRSPSSHLTRNVLCQEIVEHQPQVSSEPLCGRKKPYLTTRTAEKIHTCETCSAVFDTQFKLREHSKSHTGEEGSRPSIHHKIPLKCYVREKDFSTKRVSASHMKTHTEGKSVQVDTDDKGFSAKRSLTEEMENVNPGGHPKKQRNVVSETDVCNDEEMPGMGQGKDPPCVVERNPLKIEKVMVAEISKTFEFMVARNSNCPILLIDRHVLLNEILGKCEEKCKVCEKYVQQLRHHIIQAHCGRLNPSSETVTVFKCDICGSIFSSPSMHIRHRNTHSVKSDKLTTPCTNEPEHVRFDTNNIYPSFDISSVNTTNESVSSVQCENHPHQPVTVPPMNVEWKESSSSQSQVEIPKPYPLGIPQHMNHYSTIENNLKQESDDLESQEDLHDPLLSQDIDIQVPSCVKYEFECPEISTEFEQQTIFKTHENSSSDTPASREDFPVPSDLIRHKITHSGQKPYKCDICGKCFGKSHHLSRHKSAHTGVRPHQCDVCEMSFRQRSNLTRHRLTHTGEKSFRCDECGKDFPRKYSLDLHSLTHTEERPYKCDVCGQGYKRRSHLTRHKLRHTEEK